MAKVKIHQAGMVAGMCEMAVLQLRLSKSDIHVVCKAGVGMG